LSPRDILPTRTPVTPPRRGSAGHPLNGAVPVKRELFKSSDVCELTQLQPYVLRSWEAEFPGLGRPAAAGAGRLYRRADVDLVLRIKELVFVEGLTLAGARRRLEEEQQEPATSVAAVAVNEALDEFARTKLREVRTGLEAILKIVSRDRDRASVPELELVAPATRTKNNAAKRRRAS
jgi:DNA-binding transcriptional MerR regulator